MEISDAASSLSLARDMLSDGSLIKTDSSSEPLSDDHPQQFQKADIPDDGHSDCADEDRDNEDSDSLIVYECDNNSTAATSATIVTLLYFLIHHVDKSTLSR